MVNEIYFPFLKKYGYFHLSYITQSSGELLNNPQFATNDNNRDFSGKTGQFDYE